MGLDRIGCGLIIGLLPVPPLCTADSTVRTPFNQKKIVKWKGDREWLGCSAGTGLYTAAGRLHWRATAAHPPRTPQVMNSMFLALSQSEHGACAFMTTQIWESALPTVSYENMNGRALLEESYRAECALRAGLISYFIWDILATCAGIFFPVVHWIYVCMSYFFYTYYLLRQKCSFFFCKI